MDYQPPDIIWLDGNMDMDPMFVDEENGDYGLQANSPCIDMGTPYFSYDNNCEEGYVHDCHDGECWPQSWIGDGWCDNSAYYGVVLTCYQNDGGDCGDPSLGGEYSLDDFQMIINMSEDEYNYLAPDMCAFEFGESDIILGDLNGDGDINVMDVVNLVNVILTDSFNPNGDFNVDGFNNVMDVVALINIILGL